MIRRVVGADAMGLENIIGIWGEQELSVTPAIMNTPYSESLWLTPCWTLVVIFKQLERELRFDFVHKRSSSRSF